MEDSRVIEISKYLVKVVLGIDNKDNVKVIRIVENEMFYFVESSNPNNSINDKINLYDFAFQTKQVLEGKFNDKLDLNLPIQDFFLNANILIKRLQLNNEMIEELSKEQKRIDKENQKYTIGKEPEAVILWELIKDNKTKMKKIIMKKLHNYNMRIQEIANSNLSDTTKKSILLDILHKTQKTYIKTYGYDKDNKIDTFFFCLLKIRYRELIGYKYIKKIK